MSPTPSLHQKLAIVKLLMPKFSAKLVLQICLTRKLIIREKYFFMAKIEIFTPCCQPRIRTVLNAPANAFQSWPTQIVPAQRTNTRTKVLSVYICNNDVNYKILEKH